VVGALTACALVLAYCSLLAPATGAAVQQRHAFLAGGAHGSGRLERFVLTCTELRLAGCGEAGRALSLAAGTGGFAGAAVTGTTFGHLGSP
jgi:hypothetical protein